MSLLRGFGGQPFEGFIQCEDIDAGGGPGWINHREVQVGLAFPTLQALVGTRSIHQDSTHGFSCGPKEMASVGELRVALQPEPSLVDQCGGVERRGARLVTQAGACQTV